MSGSTFAFKQFVIKQDLCAMKVGTDAVLLGAWVNIEKSKKILDIGTGTGIISLMLAQKSEAEITAIDIDKQAVDQAIINFKESKFSSRIQAKHCSFREFYENNTEKFDLIVTNPPYFVDSLKSSDTTRSAARHADSSSA